MDARTQRRLPPPNPLNKPFQQLSKLEYKAVDFAPIDLDNHLIGTDIKDLQRKIIALCRAHFGNTIDLTEVYGGCFILDDGNKIDLDELERNLGL